MELSSADQQIALLLIKRMKGQLSPEEEVELNAWAKQSAEHEDLVQRATDPEKLLASLRKLATVTAFIDAKAEPAQQKTAVLFTMKRWMVAASLLMIVSTAAYFWLRPAGKSTPIVSNQPVITVPEFIAPSPKATLTLGDSSVIVLADIKNGDISNKAGVEIKKTADGELLYAAGSTNDGSHDAAAPWHTITTPKGGYYKLTLPDGSVAVLNAASSLHFPPRFSGDTRTVELIGEAYFEVTKDPKKRFIVEANGFKTEVLGTHFNVNAYADEPEKKITLLEGSITIIAGNSSKLLHPGQRAVVDYKSKSILVETPEAADDAIQWVVGAFAYNETPVTQVMQEISRWYDVQFEFDKNISPARLSNTKITGSFERNIPLDVLLNNLGNVVRSKLHFSLKGKTIYIENAQ